MAKVKRSVLKEIVKECLLEILFEGIDSEPGYEEEEPIREARQPRRTSRPSKKPTQKKRVMKEAPAEAAIQGLTQDPVMAAIYADTARTTLQEQKEGRVVPVDNAAAVVDSANDLEDIFEGAGNWAAIAFNETDN